MVDDRGVIYWDLEIDPAEVNRRMECALCDIEVLGNGSRTGEIFVISAGRQIGRQIGKSRITEIITDVETQAVQIEDTAARPKNKPYYRQFDRKNRF